MSETNTPELAEIVERLIYEQGMPLTHEGFAHFLNQALHDPAFLALAAKEMQWEAVEIPRVPTEEWVESVVRIHQPSLSKLSSAWTHQVENMLHWHRAMLAATPQTPTNSEVEQALEDLSTTSEELGGYVPSEVEQWKGREYQAHANALAVERLQAEVADRDSKIQGWIDRYDYEMKRANRLQAQLSEATKPVKVDVEPVYLYLNSETMCLCEDEYHGESPAIQSEAYVPLTALKNAVREEREAFKPVIEYLELMAEFNETYPPETRPTNEAARLLLAIRSRSHSTSQGAEK